MSSDPISPNSPAAQGPNNHIVAIVGALVLGALSTFGDWLWTHYIPDGAVVPGILHGVAVFFVMALVLAWGVGWGAQNRRRALGLLLNLPIAGAVCAAAFYPLYGVLGYLGALLVAWMLMWLLTAWLQQRARGNVESLPRTLLRALVAAVGSGLAFWAVSGMWTNPSPDGPNYLQHFLYWTFAFLPGFLALLVGQPRGES